MRSSFLCSPNCVALTFVALTCATLSCATLTCGALTCVTIIYVAQTCVALTCIALANAALAYEASAFVALNSVFVDCVALVFTALNCLILPCVTGLAETFCFRKLMRLFYISLKRHEKNTTTKISAPFTYFLTRHTSIVTKKYESHTFSVFFYIFL